MQKTETSKLVKVPWEEGHPTLDENAVKLTRMLRKSQGQIHAALKQKFPMLNVRKLYLDSLNPLPQRQLQKFNLVGEYYKNLPRLNYIAIFCCSFLNTFHSGFQPIYLGVEEQVRIPRILMKRLFLENPLLHDIWPIQLTAAATARSVWTETTFGNLDSVNNLGFPQLSRETLNPLVFEVTSGPHSIIKGNSVLSYMRQLQIKGQNLTRDQTIEQMRIFPVAWKIQYCDIKTPDAFLPTAAVPSWSPEWWDSHQFGQWHDVRLVRCKIPPAYKSATPANHHWTVIGFSTEPTNRIGVSPPFDRILFWRCFKCPALNGSMSMDRHLSALLQGLSFRWFYHPTSRTPNLLNTVADSNRQSIFALPLLIESADIPDNTVRRSRNTRLTRSGQINPLYDTSSNTTGAGIETDDSDADDQGHPEEQDEGCLGQSGEESDVLGGQVGGDAGGPGGGRGDGLVAHVGTGQVRDVVYDRGRGVERGGQHDERAAAGPGGGRGDLGAHTDTCQAQGEVYGRGIGVGRGGQHYESAVAGPGGAQGDLGVRVGTGQAQGGVHDRDRGVGRGGQHYKSAAGGAQGDLGARVGTRQGGEHDCNRGVGRTA